MLYSWNKLVDWTSTRACTELWRSARFRPSEMKMADTYYILLKNTWFFVIDILYTWDILISLLLMGKSFFTYKNQMCLVSYYLFITSWYTWRRSPISHAYYDMAIGMYRHAIQFKVQSVKPKWAQKIQRIEQERTEKDYTMIYAKTLRNDTCKKAKCTSTSCRSLAMPPGAKEGQRQTDRAGEVKWALGTKSLVSNKMDAFAVFTR